MDDMQSRNLTKLFSRNEEDGIQEVYELREEIPPTKAENSAGVRIVRIINWLTVPAVVAGNKESPALLEHPEAEKGLKEIVSNQDPLYIIWFSFLHELWTEDLDHINIGYADDCGWPDGGHQGPLIHSWVPQVDHQVVVRAHNSVNPAISAITYVHRVTPDVPEVSPQPKPDGH